ncbi:M16 family metallopeptidase [Bizionia sp.]|uniref:M16 family metallopeptidase n=1 Tax=Bizionia sp. TaxID=1954480 RepID=UPI003A91FFDE
MRVYKQYIKNKNYVMTSVVPKGQLDLVVLDAKEATVWIEEVKQDVASEEVGQGEEAEYEKTVSKYDRSEPAFGELPKFKMPAIWTGNLENGMRVFGIENNETPLVQFDITIPGGQLLDPKNKAGVASMLSNLMLEGTANKTPAELEEAIGLLGATINMYSTNEDFHITGTCLEKNFEETIALVKEIILEPRWDEAEYKRLMQGLETGLKDRESNPNAIASLAYNQLLYGKNHPSAIPGSGTLESFKNISLDDLKAYYSNLVPENANFHIAGAMSKSETLGVLETLNTWKGQAPQIPTFQLPSENNKNTIYFIDVPDSKQSVLNIGKLALSATNDDAQSLDFANEILGGGSSGRLFQTLRIEKGYTYGAYSGTGTSLEVAPFTVRSSVRANATLKSLEIIQDMVANYAENFTEADVELTKNKLLKANTRAYESLGAKLAILRNISKYGYSNDYIEKNQAALIAMTLEDYKNIINKYLQEPEMIYVIVGDKATQWSEIKKLGKPVVELDIFGNPK